MSDTPTSCEHAKKLGVEDATCYECLMKAEILKRDKRIAALERELAEAREGQCVWHYDKYGRLMSGCLSPVIFPAPLVEWFKFCPHCGKKLIDNRNARQ